MRRSAWSLKPCRRQRSALVSFTVAIVGVCLCGCAVNCALSFCSGLLHGARSSLRTPTSRYASTDVATVEKSSEVATQGQSARQLGLALMLDDGTRKSHSVAESTQFVTGFFKGLGDKNSFSELVTSLYFVYDAMEEAFDSLDEESVKRMDFQELRRRAAIEADMEYFHGPQWRDSISPSPATVKYCNQIRKVASESPELLIGHQYSRYVGDLFGGQMMGGMAVKSLGLQQDGPGTAFYRFQEIDNTKAFIEKWYSTLNSLDLDDAQKKAIVDEANVVFRLNIEIFEELDGSALTAIWQFFMSSLRERLGLA
eukprot:TRINITY_DN27582_c0_g1_i1.p1 TRINITY_DN27582_c0_g1~~TRINITY_DN27582_c0_g1_i1.p1  ORF type:complete len:312 (+),score=59.73 TRINITY_DN27582_c0_g1_i1:104-1039(+)